jgi:hypothetical protein
MMCFIRSICGLFLCTVFFGSEAPANESAIQAGVAVVEITPPDGYPIAGYFHERLAEGTLAPLYAKAMVLRQGETQTALIICDLIGITTDFYQSVSERASAATGIPADQIVLSATHTHTAPDYAAAFAAWMNAGQPASKDLAEEPATFRIRWIAELVERTVACVVEAHGRTAAAELLTGWTEQQMPVAFNRRFLQRDGSVRTWVGLKHAGTLRAAGPEDPLIPMLLVKPVSGPSSPTVLSNFALHLDTVGGNRWSPDYPGDIDRILKASLGDGTVSLFGTGCCGDINHVNPAGGDRNTAKIIGESLGKTIVSGLSHLTTPEDLQLQVASRVVRLPLRRAGAEQVAEATEILQQVADGKTVAFDDHVRARRVMMCDQLQNSPRLAGADHPHSPQLTSSLAGCGSTLPVRIHAISIGRDLAIVCLPGEVFVELGLTIRRASPFRTTMLIELSNCVETYYVPTQAAFAGGGYEPNNSTLQPGAGELLVEESLRLLQQLASSPAKP